MRETRTSGLTREEASVSHDMRLMRHERGNLDTDLCRHLPLADGLLYSTSRRTGDGGFRRFAPRAKPVRDSDGFSTGSAQCRLVARLGALGQRCER